MREISTEELKIILDNHAKYLTRDGGERADLRYANLSSANLRSANLRYANLSYADLSYADLRYANLRYASLRYADLSYTDLRYATLSYADLRSANLSYADLRSANLRYAIGQYYITQRTDGYQFFLVQDESKNWFIRAGCQYMTIEDYREYVKEYSDESKRIETGLILDFAEAKLKAVVA